MMMTVHLFPLARAGPILTSRFIHTETPI